MSKLENIGISKYISNFPIRHGRIKTECTDFVVQEIYKGEVCAEKPKLDISSIASAQRLLVELSKDPEFQVLEEWAFGEIASEKDVLDMYGLFGRGQTACGKENIGKSVEDALAVQKKSAETQECDKPQTRRASKPRGARRRCEETCVGVYRCTDKDARTRIHLVLKRHPFIKTKAAEGLIRFIFSGTHTYVFTVKKINRDTVSMAFFLKQRLGHVSFAGNKDKKAVTYQRMSASTDFMRLYECDVFDIRRGSSIKLGDLDGNRFTVRIRGCTIQGVTELKFLNYFGNQRFGRGLNNHEVGLCIVERRHEDALDLIIRTFSQHYETGAPPRKDSGTGGKADKGMKESASKTVYELYSEGRYADALPLVQPRFSVERHIIACRAKGLEPRAILNSVRRESLMLYVHSYQSYLFNQAVNRRFEHSRTGQAEGSGMEGGDYVISGTDFVQAKNAAAEDVWLRLEALDHPTCKGGYRKMVDQAKDLEIEACGHDTVLRFWLRPCSFATMAIRELIGDAILE